MKNSETYLSNECVKVIIIAWTRLGTTKEAFSVPTHRWPWRQHRKNCYRNIFVVVSIRGIETFFFHRGFVWNYAWKGENVYKHRVFLSRERKSRGKHAFDWVKLSARAREIPRLDHMSIFPSPWFENISEQATTIREFQDETREIWNLSRPTCYFTHRRFCCRLRQAANSSEFHFQHAIAGSPRFWSSVPLPQNQFSFARSRCAALC